MGLKELVINLKTRLYSDYIKRLNKKTLLISKHSSTVTAVTALSWEKSTQE
jgi:hypothetical protein